MTRRFRLMSLHFLVSVSVATTSGLLVFSLWYPPPYTVLAGGLTLFFMLVGIDVILGPCLTALVAAPNKPRTELRRDIAVIAFFQLLAFVYGMATIAQARPVHLVFEVDRFRIVTAADVDPAELSKATPGMGHLSWIGPTLIAARKSVGNAEMVRSLDLSLQGVDISMQPDHWVNYAQSTGDVILAGKSVTLLLEKYPDLIYQVNALQQEHRVKLETLRFLPLVGRSVSWVALVAEPDARVVGYLPVDGFF
jgi:hypothetical protein